MEYDDRLELAKYLFRYGGTYFSEAEWAAYDLIVANFYESYFANKILEEPDSSSVEVRSKRRIEWLKKKEKLEKRPEIVILLSADLSSFGAIVCERFLEEHREIIARCPRCEKLLRTPRAKQCRWCFHDWHET